MIPAPARDILLYYAGLIAVALLIFFRPRRKGGGMRLRLRGGSRSNAVEEREHENVINIKGASGAAAEKFSHIQKKGERPLNVVFNYNGHSWDAYEVLGLPAGSSPEKVDQAYRDSLASVDEGSRSFIEAAYRAIHAEWKMYKSASG